MTHARKLPIAAIGAVLVFSCAPLDPNEIAETTEALNVCHTTVVEGLDVSEFQGTINWNSVHASGREFAIARIADGGHADPFFNANYSGIHAAGMIRGAYLFWRPQISAATQAATILTAIGGSLAPGDLPPTIDVECMCPYHTGGGCSSTSYADCVSPATAASMITDLANRLTAALGRPPIIYTGTWFWNGGTYLNGALTLPSSPLWVSGYTSGCVSVPSGWTDWQVWQYSDGSCSGCVTTPVPGIPGGSGGDRNRWNGTLASLMAFTGGGGTTTPVYGARYVSQSFPLSSVGPLRIPQGGSVAASITMTNSGTATWDGNTRLGTTVARDRVDMFQGADWISDHRLAGLPAGTTVAPGAMHTFNWTFTVPPGTPTGMYDEHFGFLEEGVTWFGDPGQGGPADAVVEVIIEVTAGADAGPGIDAATPMTDSGTSGHDAGMTTGHDAGMPAGDASPIGSDGGMTMGDSGGPVTNRGINGGCGCAAAGSRSDHGAPLALGLAALAFVWARRRARA